MEGIQKKFYAWFAEDFPKRIPGRFSKTINGEISEEVQGRFFWGSYIIFKGLSPDNFEDNFKGN